MSKVLLFYKYIYIPNPEELRTWHQNLCSSLQLTGRIILASEGINGTIAGATAQLEAYKKALDEHPLFSGIDFKESDGDASCFPRLNVVVKQEIVKLGIDPAQLSAHDGGIHLTPHEAHELLHNKTDNVLVFDVRNNYESRIGSFEGAVKAPINNFRDLPEYIDTTLEQFKDKDVLMYCTGGIRCERASAYLKSKNIANNVYQITGGIHTYAEQFPHGFFKGKNYVFDARISMPITADILTTCDFCTTPYDDYSNCINAHCNKQIIVCPPCITQHNNTCSTTCAEKVATKTVTIRNLPRTYKKPSSLPHPL